MSDRTVVVDASVVVDLLIDPGDRGNAISDRLASTESHAPEHLLVEATNVLRCLRNAGQLSRAEAELAFSGLRSLPIQLWPFDVLADRIWALGDNLSSYDAAYVALAEHLDSPLLTADLRLSRAPGTRCVIEVLA